jgi:drug/metabolite transporter (DMT)-like permease
MSKSLPNRGVILALLTALISGVSVYVAKLGTQVVPDPFVYTTARNLTVGAALLVVLALRGPRVQLWSLSRASWLRLAAIAVVGGSVPFLLFFWGLTLTSAATAGLIQKTQFIWIALLATPFLGERLNRLSAIALSAILIGVAISGPLTLATPGLGAALVLAATLLWAGETVLVRRVVRDVPPLVAATARMTGGAVILLIVLGLTGRLPGLLQLDRPQLFWVVVPSVLLLGYAITWYTALRHGSAVVVSSVLSLGAPITSLIAAVATWSSFQIQLAGSPAQWSAGNVPLVSTAFLVLGCTALIATSSAVFLPQPGQPSVGSGEVGGEKRRVGGVGFDVVP